MIINVTVEYLFGDINMIAMSPSKIDDSHDGLFSIANDIAINEQEKIVIESDFFLQSFHLSSAIFYYNEIDSIRSIIQSIINQ